jgi:hypothetical protein
MGKSLKYSNTSTNSLKSNTLWKFHQLNNKSFSLSSVPAHLILSPSDNSNLLNFMNLDSIGVSTVKDSTAFKKIQFFSKTDPTSVFNIKSDFQNNFNKINSLYTSDLLLNTSYSYGMDRQHNYTSLSSTLPLFNTLLDTASVDKLFTYNLNNSTQQKNIHQNPLSVNRLGYDTYGNGSSSNEATVYQYFKLFPQKFTRFNDLDFSFFIKLPNAFSVLSAENDSKQYANPFKYSLNFKHKKKLLWNYQYNMADYSALNLDTHSLYNKFSNELYNSENILKFKDLKSSNAQFLGSERTARLLKNLNSNSYK